MPVIGTIHTIALDQEAVAAIDEQRAVITGIETAAVAFDRLLTELRRHELPHETINLRNPVRQAAVSLLHPSGIQSGGSVKSMQAIDYHPQSEEQLRADVHRAWQEVLCTNCLVAGLVLDASSAGPAVMRGIYATVLDNVFATITTPNEASIASRFESLVNSSDPLYAQAAAKLHLSRMILRAAVSGGDHDNSDSAGIFDLNILQSYISRGLITPNDVLNIYDRVMLVGAATGMLDTTQSHTFGAAKAFPRAVLSSSAMSAYFTLGGGLPPYEANQLVRLRGTSGIQYTGPAITLYSHQPPSEDLHGGARLTHIRAERAMALELWRRLAEHCEMVEARVQDYLKAVWQSSHPSAVGTGTVPPPEDILRVAYRSPTSVADVPLALMAQMQNAIEVRR